MKINFIYTPDISLEQMIGYEIAALMWGQLFTDNIEINILAKTTDQLDSNVIGGAIPEFHEQHYALFLEYYEADITSEEDQAAFDALQEGNTIDFLLNGELIDGNTKLKLTTALAKALGMTEAISLERYLLDESEHFLDGTIMMNQDFAWDFNYHRDSEAAENALDFLSVALHETGHILGFTSSLDFSLQQDTLYSGRSELSNFSPLDLFRFSAKSLGQNNPDGVVNDLSIGGVAWFSTDGGETLSARMSTGKEGDGFQASHWERRYNPLGIMDPTLWYQERVSITDLDILAFDIMGYDLSSTAGDVQNFFTPESLESLLAQAKVKVATKMGYSLEQLENNATAAPVTSLALFEEMGIDYYTVISDAETAGNNTLPPDTSGNDLDDLSDRELKDFFKDLDKMMDDIYRWWARNNSENNDDHRGSGRNGASWQEFYEWWAGNNSSGNSSWQEFYEWWAGNNSSGNSSWQELYEWWAGNNSSGNSSWQELYEWYVANNSSGNSSWQELYEWWAGNNSSGNSSWQELSEEELAKFHQEVTGNQPSWWEQVFFASQDGGNLAEIKLPGENSQGTIVGPIHYQEFNGGHDDDIFGGDLSNDTIVGGKGDDLMDGAAGDDTIFGAGGFDTIFGFDGNDSIMGGQGDDVISGESDEDVLFGQAGADVLLGGDHDDYLDGGDGRDFLNGNTGDDALIGGAGDDALEGESGKDLLVGGTGEDIGNGGSGDDFIFGDEYSESLKQTFGRNLSNLTSLFTPDDASTTETPVVDNTSTNNTNNLVLAQDPIKLEAENMNLSGGYYQDDYYYNGTAIRTSSSNPNGVASQAFTGETGYYQVVVRYIDESDGNASLSVQIAGTEIDSWVLDQNTSGDNQYYSRTISEGMYIDANAVIEIQGQAESSEYARVDYIEFIPVEAPANNVVLAQDPIKLEAENMNLSGGYYQDDYYYNGTAIRTSSSNPNGVASQAFTGETGYYQVVVRYIDESDGNASLSVQIAGTEIDSWVLDQNTSGDNQYYSRTISEGMYIDANAAIEIQGQAESSEYARVDYIEFIPVEAPATSDSNDTSPTDVDLPPEPINITPELELGLNSDILRGGAGNDGIDGGAGNDIIFGEDELNDSSYITAPLIDGAFHYGHSTYILSQAGTWQEAQAEAQSYGGNLVTINDAAENQWLLDTFGVNNNWLWTGFTDQDQEGTFKWASGEAVTYTNWAPGQPYDDGGNQHYAILNWNNQGWDDNQGTWQWQGIIEVDWSSVGGNDTIFGGAGDDQVYGNSGNDVIYGDSYGNTTSNTPGTLTFQQNVNGYNGTVDTTLEEFYPNSDRGNETGINIDMMAGDLVAEGQAQALLKFDNIFGSQPGQIGMSDTINSALLEIDIFNTGGNIEFYEMLQGWSDSATWNSMGNGIQTNGTEAANTPVVIANVSNTGIVTIDVTASLQAWQANPNSNQGWALLPTNDDGVDFNSAEGTIAPRLVVDVNQGNSTTINNLDNAYVHNGSIYLLTDSIMTWDEAQAQAQSLGGNLVTINDASEEQWLQQTFGTSELFWTGLSDVETEGTFKWASGEVSDWVNGAANNGIYTNWSPGQPDDYLDNQDYVAINYTMSGTTDNLWDDRTSYDSLRGIIEIKLSSTASGNDNLFGNGGHDTINGGAGNDVVNGTDEVVAGYLERDVLVGGAGADTFILGDDTQAYYATGDSQDYAVIQDFAPSEDKVQLYGMASDYQQQQQGDDIHLSRNGDLVAILEKNSTLNLNGSSFEYVVAI